MLLKRLVVQGYKTFATKTEFVFDEGVTAIVGPNGSGKSNVADALRWVLGEQSYRSLRGKQTTDMIFAGSRSRPRAGMAQVVLTLDNSNGWLPIDYAEVEIGRRAYRSGENEYLINGQKVRLRDVHELLATSGLAERNYTIIGQGLIDKALSLKSEERRALFEEAAGISHYKARRAETLRRLKETQRNLQRVHDILAEIKPRMASLRRQANRARNYEQVGADLRHLLLIWYGHQWAEARTTHHTLRDQGQTSEKAWQEARRYLLAQQEEIRQQRLVVTDLEQQIRDKRDARDMLRDEREKARRQVAVGNERRQLVQRQLAEVEADLPRMSTSQTSAQTELQEALQSLQAAQATLGEQEATLVQFNASFQGQQSAIDAARAAVTQYERQQRKLQSEQAQRQGQLSQLSERLQEQQKETDASAKLAELAAEIAKTELRVGSAQEAVNRLREERQTQRDAVKADQKALRQQQQTLGEQNRRLNKQGKQLARLETRVEMLDQLRGTASQADDGQITGRFATLIDIPDAHRVALEAALREQLGTLITPDQAALWSLLAAQPESATVQLAALDGPNAYDVKPLPALDGIIARASDMVTVDKQITTLGERLLAPIVLVEDDAAAYAVGTQLQPGEMAVAPSGLVVHATGLVERQPAGGSNSILARETAWRSASDQLDTDRTALAELQDATDELQKTVSAAQKALNKANDEERRLGRLANEASQRLTQAQRDLDRQIQQQSFQQRAEEQRQQAADRLTQRIDELRTFLSQQAAELETVAKQLAEAQRHLAALPVAETRQQRVTLQQQITSAQTIVAGRQAVVDSRRSTMNQVDTQIARLEQRRESLLTQEKELQIQAGEAELKQLEEALTQLEASLEPLRASEKEARVQLKLLEEEQAAAQTNAHERETRFTEAKLAVSQHDNYIDSLRERIRNDIGIVDLNLADDEPEQSPLPLADVVEHLPDVDELPDDIEENIRRYRGQMQRMGGINPDAPAEYEETRERFEFLTEQIDDLNSTETQLRDVIAELDDLTSRAFGDTVIRVNAVFGKTFTQLFGGGTAELVLTDPDDLTVSGVDILAQLPRRRQQGLGLLSGGERSLTAAALIFSLLKVSPTPFCVMDEVDAMLDEANVNRFRDLLRELSLQTQFIVITHNRGTVQAAATVYGISMGSDSASQVISIKPEEYINAAELV